MLILGSGNVVHNLRRIDWQRADARVRLGPSASTSAARELMTAAPSTTLAELRRHADFAAAAPTPDHFIPLLYLAGLASAQGTTPEVLVQGCTLGSLSMTSYGLGLSAGEGPAGAG